jgi:hypothetical protein
MKTSLTAVLCAKGEGLQLEKLSFRSTTFKFSSFFKEVESTRVSHVYVVSVYVGQLLKLLAL